MADITMNPLLFRRPATTGFSTLFPSANGNSQTSSEMPGNDRTRDTVNLGSDQSQPLIYNPRMFVQPKKEEKKPEPFQETKLPGEDALKIAENKKNVVMGKVDIVSELNDRKSANLGKLSLKPAADAVSDLDAPKGLFKNVKPSTPGTLDKVMGPWGMLTGGKDVMDGFTRIGNGDNVGGGLNIAKGVTSFTGGALNTASIFTRSAPLTSLFSESAAVTSAASSTLGKAIPVVAATTAMVDGISTTYDGYQTGDKEKMIIGGIKTGSGAVMMAGVMTGNPFLVAGGGVTYAGAVLYENRQAISDFVFGPSTPAPNPEPKTLTAEGSEPTIVDWSTMDSSKAQTVMTKMPAKLTEGSSRGMRDQILVDNGFTPQDVAAYKKAYPRAGLGEKEAGFYVGSNDGKTWASKQQMEKWSVNENGYTSIEMSPESVAHLKAFYARRRAGE